MNRTMKIPQEQSLNQELSKKLKREVISLESIEVLAGEVFKFSLLDGNFEDLPSLFIGTEGDIAIDDHLSTSGQARLFLEEKNVSHTVKIMSTDGFLRFYNEWETADGDRLSLWHPSGMIVEQIGSHSTKYECNANDPKLNFNSLVFTLEKYN